MSRGPEPPVIYPDFMCWEPELVWQGQGLENKKGSGLARDVSQERSSLTTGHFFCKRKGNWSGASQLHAATPLAMLRG